MENDTLKSRVEEGLTKLPLDMILDELAKLLNWWDLMAFARTNHFLYARAFGQVRELGGVVAFLAPEILDRLTGVESLDLSQRSYLQLPIITTRHDIREGQRTACLKLAPTLKSLSLRYNNGDFNGVLRKMTALTALELPFGEVDRDEWVFLTKLRKLSLRDNAGFSGWCDHHLNNLTDLDVRGSPSTMGDFSLFTSLTALKLGVSSHQSSPNEYVYLESLPSTLQLLVVQNVYIYSEKALSRLTSLETLVLDGCHRVRYIPFASLTRLTTLKLKNCEFGTPLSTIQTPLPLLERVVLTGHRTPVPYTTVPYASIESLRNHTRLHTLKLDCHNLIDLHFIAKLPALTALHLSVKNLLTVDWKDTIVPKLSRLWHLTIVETTTCFCSKNPSLPEIHLSAAQDLCGSRILVPVGSETLSSRSQHRLLVNNDYIPETLRERDPVAEASIRGKFQDLGLYVIAYCLQDSAIYEARARGVNVCLVVEVTIPNFWYPSVPDKIRVSPF